MIYVWVILVLSVVWFLFGRKKRTEYFQCDEEYREKMICKIINLDLPYASPDEVLTPFDSGCISYVDSAGSLTRAIEDINKETFLGVDIEEYSKNSYLGFICLIQIATSNKVYLIDTIKLRKELKSLSGVFGNPLVTKIFHSCSNDTLWLQRDFGIICVNVFDTQISAKILGLEHMGLSFLWEKFCGFSMSKDYKKKMQLSRWDLRPLTREQIEYAATDAFYLKFLMKKMLEKMKPEQILQVRKECNSVCMKKYSKEINSEKCLKQMKKNAIQAIDSHGFLWFSELVKIRDDYARRKDLNAKALISDSTLVKISEEKPENFQQLQKFAKSNKFLQDSSSKILEINKKTKSVLFEIITESTRKENPCIKKKKERYDRFLKKYTINKKVYENCQIQAPDGEILCFTDMKKANWYVERDLAIVMNENPLIIRLNFEPNGRGFSDVEADQLYYSKEKKNECVSCGSTANYLKYHVVPLLYRQFFPKDYKSHRSHDVVLLCAKCHELANKHSDKLKKQIALEYEVPLNSLSELQKIKDDIQGVRKVALSLKKNSGKIPADRKEALEDMIRKFIYNNERFFEYFKDLSLEESTKKMCGDGFCSDLMKMLGDVNWKKELSNNHGKRVVEKVSDLKGFIRRWRVHFIECVDPKFLPDSWNVDHLLNSPKFK